MPNHRPICWLRLVVTSLAIMGLDRAARAQDDVEPDDNENAQAAAVDVRMVQQMPNFEQVDQWIFGRYGGSGGARNRLDSALALRLEDLGRSCGLTDAQRRKLKIAGRGDIKRFFDRVEELKRRFQAQTDPNANIWQEIQPLQIEINAGLFGDNSIYAKTIRSTLTGDQTARYTSLLRERNSLRYRATVEWFVVHLDKGLGMSDDQRQKLVDMLVNETRPPKKFGQGDFWYLMLQTARVPEALLKPIFDVPQWRLLNRQFAQARGMEHWLRTNGVMPDDEKDGNQADMAVVPQVRTRRLSRPAVAPGPPAEAKKAAVPKKHEHE